MEKLLNKLPNIPFTTQAAKRKKVSLYYLQKLVDLGHLQKLRKGVYQKAKTDWGQEDSFREIVTTIGKNSCICLWSALSFYDLTEEVPSKIWIYVPYGKYSNLSHIKVVRKRRPNFTTGVIRQEGFKITSIERTVVEALSDVRHISKKEGVAVLKRALEEKKIKVASLIKISKKLKLFSKIVDYLEIYA